MTLRAIIVEDEPLARARLRALLAPDQTVVVVAEADNARTGAELIRQLQPDVLFLDIHMPEISGLDLARSIEPGTRPAVVFITAHPEYALDAFDTNAADYLVKPLDGERVARALERVRRFIAGGSAAAQTRHVPRRTRFAVRTRGEIVFVKVSQIDWIAAEGNYVRLHAGEASYLLRESMQSMEDALDPVTFIRVHRSAIVNLDRVRKLVTTPDGSAGIVLSTGATVPLGPTYRIRLEDALGQKL